MKKNYVLIDYENVQPKNLGVLKGHDFKVMVFVGANQTKIPFELAEALGPPILVRQQAVSEIRNSLPCCTMTYA